MTSLIDKHLKSHRCLFYCLTDWTHDGCHDTPIIENLSYMLSWDYTKLTEVQLICSYILYAHVNMHFRNCLLEGFFLFLFIDLFMFFSLTLLIEKLGAKCDFTCYYVFDFLWCFNTLYKQGKKCNITEKRLRTMQPRSALF